MNDDRMLRQQFAALRRAEEVRVPRFERVIGRTRRRSSRGLRGLTVAACVLLVAVTIAMVRGSHRDWLHTIHSDVPMLVDWHAPTDFLLDTPGRELLHSIPDIGRYSATEFWPLPPTRRNTPAPHAGREHS
jgi:hypothetical protein